MQLMMMAIRVMAWTTTDSDMDAHTSLRWTIINHRAEVDLTIWEPPRLSEALVQEAFI